ncbi:MAG TPA: hypothetical protein DCF61_10200 [Alphaproteobacteria bacterium]|nr:hypothetical protein [Alphaproteobacteria bacterium]
MNSITYILLTAPAASGWHMSCYSRYQDRTSRIREADRFIQELVVIGAKAGGCVGNEAKL